MGACECENPMEFGYEVNAEEKDEKNKSQNQFKENNNINASNNNNKNYVNTVSNVMSSDSYREKNNMYNSLSQRNNNDMNSNQNISNKEEIKMMIITKKIKNIFYLVLQLMSLETILVNIFLII